MLKMLRRFLWLFTGVGLGAGLTLRIQRRIQRMVAAMRPGSVADRALGGARAVGSDTRAAVREGRRAMRAREAELRAELEQRRQSGAGSVGGAPKPPTSFV
jgi:hypothetical protein